VGLKKFIALLKKFIALFEKFIALLKKLIALFSDGIALFLATLITSFFSPCHSPSFLVHSTAKLAKKTIHQTPMAANFAKTPCFSHFVFSFFRKSFAVSIFHCTFAPCFSEHTILLLTFSVELAPRTKEI